MYVIDPNKCQRAGDCVQACPIEAIVQSDGGTMTITEDCTACGACEPACDAKAIRRA